MGQQVKLLLSYNIRPGVENVYRRFVMEELFPQAQELGLVPTDAWHTAYGNYPSRLIGFVADDLDAARKAQATERWKVLMKRLDSYSSSLSLRVVNLRGGFQW